MFERNFVNQLSNLFKLYRNTRAPGQQGVISYLLTQPPPGISTILLNHNDYLALANHPYVIEKQISSLQNQQDKIMMSGVFLNSECYKLDVEQKLADFVRKKKVCIFQSGLCANISVLEAISNSDTAVYVDQRAHASYWFGLRETRARIIPFRHNNVADLERKILKYGAGPILIDSIYSAHGTIAPIEQIIELKKTYYCFLVVDESHSLGLFGKNGAGLLEQLNCIDDVDCITASLSKTFCTRAGMVAGDEDFMLFMKEKSTPMIFSSTLPNYDLARIDAMIDILTSVEADGLREKLHAVSAQLRKSFTDIGYRLCAENPESPIISIPCGEEADCLKLRLAFDAKKIYLAPFFQPATPPKETLLRLTVNSGISDEQLDYIIKTLSQIKHTFLQEPKLHYAFDL